MNRTFIYLPKGIKVPGVPAPRCEDLKLPAEVVNLKRVWTIYAFCSPDLPPPNSFKPKHLEGAFLEDQLHDWIVTKGHLRYRSRTSDGGCWLLLEHN